MPKAIDLSGKRFGRLFVVGFAGTDSKRRRLWNCRCDCGNEKIQSYGSLTVSKVQSCGCLTKEKITKHGQYKTKIYFVWHSMIRRCKNSTDQAYQDYGQRGIIVSNEWLDFMAFKNDMGPRPPGASLDRIDVNGNYCKENCRWATALQQANNRRNNIRIQYNGEIKTISEWARSTGISKTALRYRLNSKTWTVARALETPVDRSINVSTARSLLFKKQ